MDVGKFTIINDRELFKLFNELTPKIQNKIISTGLKNAARLIINKAKRNFKSIKKGKSKTEYRDFNSSFTVREMRSRAGVIAGLASRKEGYKYRFIDQGTEERHYKTKKGNEHRTGRMPATHWFTSAVDDSQKTAAEDVQQAVVKSLNKTVEKYNKKYRL